MHDRTYLERFASLDLEPEHFDHRGHLFIAWLHLIHYDEDEAVQRVCEGLRGLASKFGAQGKYHQTLTEALVRIMARRMRSGEGFEAFLEANPDLLKDCQSTLSHYYSDERLHSETARVGWVAPDRQTLP